MCVCVHVLNYVVYMCTNMHIKVSRNQINVKLNTNKAIKIDSFCYTEKKGSGKYLLTILNASMSKNEKKKWQHGRLFKLIESAYRDRTHVSGRPNRRSHTHKHSHTLTPIHTLD